MKRLEDIPKKQSFKVPDGYFEDLPMRIQARIQAAEKKPSWIANYSLVWKFALPLLLVGIISATVWYNVSEPKDSFSNLDTVPTEQLLAYLESDDITTEEIIENARFTNASINSLYDQNEEIPTSELDDLTQQYDFNF